MNGPSRRGEDKKERERDGGEKRKGVVWVIKKGEGGLGIVTCVFVGVAVR